MELNVAVGVKAQKIRCDSGCCTFWMMNQPLETTGYPPHLNFMHNGCEMDLLPQVKLYNPDTTGEM